MTDFSGHDGRECGEHRTTGIRAWCFSCSEWCYPTSACAGCELPRLRHVAEAARGLAADLKIRLDELSGSTLHYYRPLITALEEWEAIGD